jgi:hypothetical protein
MIEADYDTLLRQATMTAHDYMLHAVADIDKLLGKGYAKDHPELIAAYMQTAARDFGAGCLAKEISEAAGDLAGAISGLSESMRSDHPLQGETFDGIAGALMAIAEARKAEIQ